MKVRIIECSHELDLEDEVNDFKEIISKKRNREKLTTEEVVRLKSYFNSIQ